YDGSRKNHFFPRVVPNTISAGSLRTATALCVAAHRPCASTSPTCPQFNQRNLCRELAAHQMKGGLHGYQLRKYLQPPQHATVAADSGFKPGSQLGRGLLVAGG